MEPSAIRSAHCTRCAGLSYVETLVCIAISALLLSLAAAPLRNAVVRQRIQGVRTELVAALHWARWEALRRNTTVTLQRRTDCDAALPGNDHWHCGWHLVAGDGPPAATPAEDSVLQSFTLPPGLRLLHTGGGAQLQFARTGYPLLVAHKFVVGLPGNGRDAVDPRQASTLCMNRTGRVRNVEGQTTC